MNEAWVISEMEWWDRVAMALDLLAARQKLSPRPCLFEGENVGITSNRQDIPFQSRPSGGPTRASAYFFSDLRDSEILRRLTQMPDETFLDLLTAPFLIHCPEMKSLVSVNHPVDAWAPQLKEFMKGLSEGS